MIVQLVKPVALPPGPAPLGISMNDDSSDCSSSEFDLGMPAGPTLTPTNKIAIPADYDGVWKFVDKGFKFFV